MTALSAPAGSPGAAAPSAAPPTPFKGRVLVGCNLVLLASLTAALMTHLWPQWRHNPDLSHGPLMPLVGALLVWQGRKHGPPRHPRSGALTLAAVFSLLVAALACLAIAGLFAVSLGWSQNLVSFMLTTAFVLGLVAAGWALSAEPLCLVPANWTVFCAAALWLLTAPFPPGTYATLTLRLQIWVTGHVLSTLHLLGVAARQQGNLIELATTTVGVEEACAGVRSLIACVYAGVFFGAWLVRRPWARVLLLALAAPLALAMNFVRSLTLTLLADAGVDIGGFWHNATGFAVLGVTAGLLLGLAFLLESARPAAAPAPAPTPARVWPPALFATQAVLAIMLVVAAGLAAFFVVNTHRTRRDDGRIPDLAAMLPETAPGWQVLTSSDLTRFASTLETDHLVQRTYYRGAGDAQIQLTVYLAYWPAGRTSVSSVAMHTPDACWPGAGWQAMTPTVSRFAPVVAGREVPPVECRLFSHDGFLQHVWFWHLLDGVPITQRDPYSPRELLAVALRYGFRQDGAQLFVRVSSNRPWNDLAAEPLLADILARLRTVGL